MTLYRAFATIRAYRVHSNIFCVAGRQWRERFDRDGYGAVSLLET
jgi:hypothetical protein